MLQGGYLRGADYDQKHSYQSCYPHSLYFCRFGRATDSSYPRGEAKRIYRRGEAKRIYRRDEPKPKCPSDVPKRIC